MGIGTHEQRTITLLHVFHPRAMLFGKIHVWHGVTQQRWHQHQGQQYRAEQGKRKGVRHRRKYFSFNTLKGKDGQEGQNNDGLGKQDRPPEIHRRLAQRLHPPTQALMHGIVVAGAHGQPHHQSLHQHHRTIDDDAKINRAQRNQIGGNAFGIHQNKRGKQRQWNDGGHRKGGIQIAQEQQQHRHHQHRAHRQIMRDRLHRVLHQLRTVIVGFDRYAGRQLLLHPFQLALQIGNHHGGVLPLDHLHDALNDVVRIVECHQTRQRPVPDGNLRHIADDYGPPAA